MLCEASMKAVYRTIFGDSSVLSIKEVSRPIPKAGELLIKVHYTTINRTDTSLLSGKPYIMRAFAGIRRPKRKIPGTDFAGEVCEIGPGPNRFSVGDRVWGFNDLGLSSQAEYLVINDKQAIALIPEGVSYAQAVASAEGAHYALNTLNKTVIKEGTRVLVNGATGAIGSAAIQLLKHAGARVMAVGPGTHTEQVLALGAETMIDFTEQSFTQVDEQFQYIFDAVGKSRFADCRHLLLPGGAYLSSEPGPRLENIYLPLITLFSSRKVIFPVPFNPQRSLNHLNPLLASAAFRPLIDRIYPPKDIQEAYAFVASGQKIGNVLLKFV